MPPRKKQNSSSSTTSSRKSNSNNQPQPSKFGIQHFFERHTQNVLASQKLQNASHPTISVPKPANEVQSCNVNLASLNPKDDSMSNKNRPSNASPKNPIVELGVDAQPLVSLSEVSPEISKSLSLKRFKFSPGMLIKQSQDDGGDEITWRISPVNEKLQTVSKRIPEAVRMLADASRLNSLSIHQCSKNEGTTKDFEKWDSSSSTSRASERSLVSSLNKVGLKRVNPDHNVDVNGSLTDITSSGFVSKESPFRTPPSLSYCHAKLANEVACNGTSDHPGLRQHKKALLELLDQVEDVISVEVPVAEKPMTSLCPVKDTNGDEIAAKSNLAVKTSARQLLKKRIGASSNCHFLVLEVSETCEPAHSSNAQCPYKVLRLLNEQNGAERSLYLWDEWFYSLVAPGDTVNVIGEFDDQEKCHVKHDINFLIIHPDILVSGTRVAGSFNCPRRTVLDERLRCSEHSTAALIGTLFHEIFQVALTMEMPTISFLEDFARSVIQKHMESLYACGVNDNDMHRTLVEGIPKLLGWVNFYKNSQDSEVPVVEFGSDVGTKNITVSEVLDIEEMAWAPKYGLKGMIDASIKVKVGSNKYEANEKVMPLEFKTGKPPNGQSSMEHTAQVILYTLLMSERYKKHIDSGLLYYLQSDQTQGITVQRSDLIGLIMRRNELANDLLKALTKQVLPPMLQSQSICRSCRHLSVCAIYHKGHGGNTDSSGLGDLFDSNTDHLTAAHSTFLRHWDWLIDLETKVMQLAKIEIWRSRSLEIDPAIGCLFSIIPEGGLPYRKSEKDNRYIYRFVRYDVPSDNDEMSDINFLNANSSPKKYLDCNLRIGDHVILGNESGHLTVATGIVTDLRDIHVSVSFAKRLRIPGSTCPEVSDLLKEVWRIDKDEFMTSFAVMRFNLVQLFLPSAQSTHIRKMIVDLEVPRFDSGCILSQDPAIAYIWSEKNLNDDQRQAILKILAAKDYTLILGMPGTGKTSTMVHAVRALLIRGASILLTSYTNSAVDNLLIKLKAQNIDFLRIGRQEAVHEEVRGYCFAAESTQSVGDIKSRLEQVKIVAVTCLGITSPLLASKKFDICIMDEAGQTTLPVSLGPLMFASTFVLVGDHYQLPPLVQSVEARENGMGVSLFRRLSEAHPQAISVLRSQYRMCQSIMALSNALIYGNKLRCGSPDISDAKLKFSSRMSGSSWLNEILDPSRPVIFVNTDMLPAFETKDHKTVNNPMEAHIVVQVTEELVNNGIEGEDIGIITPYNSQANIIRHSTNLTSVEIHTIDKYQGRDKDCVLVSFVRSNENPRNCTSSLLGDWHRINVALTRAKKKLIMVGSCKTLSKVPLLKLLIEKVDEQSGIFNVSKKDVECRRELKRCSQLR